MLYQDIRNASWQCLIDCKICSLPIQISNVCKLYGGKVVNNSDVHLLTKKQSGRIIAFNNNFYVIVNDNECIQRIRFTIAHELGHYLLGHLENAENKHFLYRDEITVKPRQETEADMFAARLLAPACVLWGLNATTPAQIASVCNISITSAKYRSERLKVLKNREMFLSSPLERQVYSLFEDYINDFRFK